MPKQQTGWIAFLVFISALVITSSWLYIWRKSVAESFSNQPLQVAEKIYQVKEGSIFVLTPNGQSSLVIDKARLTHERLRIQYIIDYAVSPDKSKLLLYAEGGVDPYVIYAADADGQEVEFVGTAQEARWSPDSQVIAYTDLTTVGQSRLFTFNFDTKERRASSLLQNDCYMNYSQVDWQDANTIQTDFQCLSSVPYGREVEAGQTDIPISKLEFWEGE